MTLVLLPDVERIATGYLRSVPEVAALVETRVFTELPPDPAFPLVRLERIGGIPVFDRWFDVARLQVEAWGTTKVEARDLASTVLAALWAMPGPYPLGVITEVECVLGLSWQPDRETDRPRYLFDVYVYAHPDPEGATANDARAAAADNAGADHAAGTGPAGAGPAGRAGAAVT